MMHSGVTSLEVSVQLWLMCCISLFLPGRREADNEEESS